MMASNAHSLLIVFYYYFCIIAAQIRLKNQVKFCGFLYKYWLELFYIFWFTVLTKKFEKVQE